MNAPAGRKSRRRKKKQITLATGPMSRIRNYFLTGVVVIAPISLTIYLSWLFIDWVDDTVRPLIPVKYNPETYLPFSLPGLGVLVVFIFLTFVGFITANLFGRTIIRAGERLLGRMPVIRSIYSAFKQVFETVLKSKSQSFRQAVLIEYPRKGLSTIAFVTADTGGEVQREIGGDLVTVYVPTTPNPTSGFMIVVPREELVFLDMSVENAVKMVISMGVIEPPGPEDRKLTVIPADQRAKLRKKVEKRQANGNGNGNGNGRGSDTVQEKDSKVAGTPSAGR